MEVETVAWPMGDFWDVRDLGPKSVRTLLHPGYIHAVMAIY